MDHDHPTAWTLTRFQEHLDRWAEREDPDQDTRIIVADWVLSRADNPYAGVRRDPRFDNLWYGRIPYTLDDNDTIMICSYFILERTKIIRCNDIARLGLPI